MIQKIKKLDFRGWVTSLLAGAISGAAGAFTAGGVATFIDPADFGFAAKTAKLMGGVFCVGALMGIAAVLKQSPLPPVVEVEREVPTDKLIDNR